VHPLAAKLFHECFGVLLVSKRKTWYHSFCQTTECPFRESVSPFARQNSWTFS